MPTLVHTFPDIEFIMRLNQPRATEGLNQKEAVSTAPGVYRGFLLTTSAFNQTVQVDPDPVALDNFAVYQTADGFSLAVRTVGSFNIDLSAEAGNTVVLAVEGTYSVVSPTTMVIQTYTEAEFAALSAADQERLVVMGTIVVPGAAIPIPAADITFKRRVSSYLRIAREAEPWPQVLTNGGFEHGLENGTHAFAVHSWILSQDANLDLRRDTTGERTGLSCLAGQLSSAAVVTASATQPLRTTVQEGQRIRVEAFVDVVQAAAGGTLELRLNIDDVDGAALATLAETDPVSSVAGYRKIEATFVAPAGASRLRSFVILLNALDYTGAGAGAVLRIDDVNVWVEPRDQARPEAGPAGMLQELEWLVLGSRVSDFTDDADHALLRHDGQDVILERRDQNAGAGTHPGLTLRGLLNALVDASVGNDLDVGNALAVEALSALKNTVTFGANILSTNANAEVARAAASLVDTAVSPRTYTLLATLTRQGSSVPSIHLYGAVDDTDDNQLAFALSFNAVWDNDTATWNRATASVHAYKLEWQSQPTDGSYRLEMLSKDATATASWADSAWDRNHLTHEANAATLKRFILGIETAGTGLRWINEISGQQTTVFADFDWADADVRDDHAFQVISTPFQQIDGNDDGSGQPLRLANIQNNAGFRDGHFMESFHEAIISADAAQILEFPIGPHTNSDDWNATVIADIYGRATDTPEELHVYTRHLWNFGSYSGNVSGNLFFGTGGAAGTSLIGVQKSSSRGTSGTSHIWTPGLTMNGSALDKMRIIANRIQDSGTTALTSEFFVRLQVFFDGLGV